jgi:hypothetical protein
MRDVIIRKDRSVFCKDLIAIRDYFVVGFLAGLKRRKDSAEVAESLVIRRFVGHRLD